MIDNFLQAADQNKISLISGDLPLGTWELEGTTMKRVATQTSETIDLSTEVKSLELKNEVKKNQYEPYVGAGVGALLGLRMFGLIGAAGGAIAGHFLMSPKPEVSVTCELKDGRSFIAVMSPTMLDRLRSFTQN